jgi:hypothetical protein
MATQESVLQPLSRNSSNVVQITALPSLPITQLELTTLLSLRCRARKIDEDIADAERSIRTRLEAGGYIEPGEHSATLKESFRRSVSWREVAERLGDKLFGTGKGDSYCERVLRSTKPARTVSLQIS